MYVYAGIDEAGYGPLLGPLVVGRFVLAIPKLSRDAVPDGQPPAMWQRLSKAVSKTLRERKGRIVVNDSKKLKTAASGVRHLELSCLAFAALAGDQPQDAGDWLDALSGGCSDGVTNTTPPLPNWYQPCESHPWQKLPSAVTPGELAVARSMLAGTAQRIGVEAVDYGAAVVCEPRFNTMVSATRSKAATSFTFVAGHLQHILQRFGEHDSYVVVDRQGGRTAYRALLAECFPDADVSIEQESPQRSAYRIEASPNPSQPTRKMSVCFEVQADGRHMPAALASMVSKYTRELLMQRLNAYFGDRVEGLAPTAGYGSDGKRYWQQLQPHLAKLDIPREHVLRMA